MTTFSTSLKLELPGDGSQVGTWGQTVNKNFGTLVEQAITGVVTITMVDANYTLTNLNGVSDEARNAVIIATGTNSAQRDVIAPLVEKLYYIINNTTGGYAIRIIGASGTGVTVPNGSCVPVYCDGTNFSTLLTSTSGNFTVNGNETVTGTLGVTGAISGTTASFSGAISSVSPAFTGTPTAPTATTGTNTTQIATTAFVQAATGTLGTMSTQNANNVNITGGSISGTNINTYTVGSNATGAKTISSSAPSAGTGSDGDVWYQI
jgi:hypothetical protein